MKKYTFVLVSVLFVAWIQAEASSVEERARAEADQAQQKWEQVDVERMLAHPPQDKTSKNKVMDLTLSEFRFQSAVKEINDFRDAMVTNSARLLRGTDGPQLRDFKMLVFPLLTEQNLRNNLQEEAFYAAPIEFTFRVKWQKSCAQMTEPSIDGGRYLPQKYFAAALKNHGKICSIVRVFPSQNPVRMAKDEVKEIALYIDEDFKTYGYDVFQYVNRDSDQDRITRFDFKEPALSMSSGLFLFPVDLPSLAMLSFFMDKAPQVKSLVPADAYVRNKVSKLIYGKRAERQSIDLDRICRAQKQTNMEYRDQYGSKVSVSWCSGDQWPTVVRNNRFFAILKKAR